MYWLLSNMYSEVFAIRVAFCSRMKRFRLYCRKRKIQLAAGDGRSSIKVVLPEGGYFHPQSQCQFHDFVL